MLNLLPGNTNALYNLKQEHFIIFHYYIAIFIWQFQPQSMEEEEDSNASYTEVGVNPESD